MLNNGNIEHTCKLVSLKSVVKSCIYDDNQRLIQIVESRDSLLIVSVRQNLSKLRHVFALLNQMQGVSGSGASLKQGEGRTIKN